MQTVQLDIQDDKLNIFLNIIDNLKTGIIEKVRLQGDLLDIEVIEYNSEDYLLLQKTKSENNTKYTIEEAKAKLDF